MENKLYKIKSIIFGLAVGDALGVPVEFSSREELDNSPVETMEGFGTYPFPAGTWSDDTSMTLASLDSLASGINYNDMMNKFCEWIYNDKYTPSDETFDMGNTTSFAIDDYYTKNKPALSCGRSGEYDNGNGSLMRISPIVLYCYYSMARILPLSSRMQYINNISALTHAHPRSMLGCGVYAFILWELLNTPEKTSVINGIKKAKDYYSAHTEAAHYVRILDGDISLLKRNEIKSGGYVVSCLEAALWCLLTTDSYTECVLKAVNLGDDTDTTAAVAGSLAGALYGYDSIPQEWLDTLIRSEFIDKLCENAALSW